MLRLDYAKYRQLDPRPTPRHFERMLFVRLHILKHGASSVINMVSPHETD